MRRILGRRPSPAMVVACIALSVALSGVGYAAVALPRGSVGTAQLKKGAVSTAKIKKNAVTTAKMRNNAVTSAKIRNGAVATPDFAADAKAPSAGSADSAANANLLDGVDSAAFQRRCASGGITAYAYVDVSDLTTSYADLNDGRFTCANGTNTVRAKETANGKVTVDFGYTSILGVSTCPGVAIGTIAQHSGGAGGIRVEDGTESTGGPITFRRCVYNVETFTPSTFVAVDFTIMQLDPSGGGLIILP